MKKKLRDQDLFSKELYQVMQKVDPGIEYLELYEFQYGLNNMIPSEGWDQVKLDSVAEIEARVSDRKFYDSINIKPKVADRIVLDDQVLQLSQMLFVGLVTGDYPVRWVNKLFYFDIRGFFFLHRTDYFTDEIVARFGGKPYRQFPMEQKRFDTFQDLGYKDFMAANQEVDNLFIDTVANLIEIKGTPILFAIAGPTAAGKTEITKRLQEYFKAGGKRISLIEMDNFLTDREEREAKGIFTQGKKALHFELLKKSLTDICQGRKISIPRYDFVFATSSHDNSGNLKPGGVPIEIEPADIIFIEGNFPFLIDEIAHLINLKVVYLTDDPIRLKRKWKRDIDYRKKYEPTYFRNRYFKDQFIMAEIAYRPQLGICDMAVDTTGAALWVTPELTDILNKD
ncbi:MAG: uridine kinase [Anaerolineales bacterium]